MELVDIYDKNRQKTGVVKDRYEIKKGEFMPCVHAWIINSENKFIVQKRSATKRTFPNFWTQSMGGGLEVGETSIEGLKRELKEELGIDILKEEVTLVGTYLREATILDVWVVRKKEDIDINSLVLQEEEVSEAKYVTFKEFDKMIDEGIVSPSIESSYTIFKTYINHYELKE